MALLVLASEPPRPRGRQVVIIMEEVRHGTMESQTVNKVSKTSAGR